MTPCPCRGRDLRISKSSERRLPPAIVALAQDLRYGVVFIGCATRSMHSVYANKVPLHLIARGLGEKSLEDDVVIASEHSHGVQTIGRS